MCPQRNAQTNKDQTCKQKHLTTQYLATTVVESSPAATKSCKHVTTGPDPTVVCRTHIEIQENVKAKMTTFIPKIKQHQEHTRTNNGNKRKHKMLPRTIDNAICDKF
jgi:hypothetical protein